MRPPQAVRVAEPPRARPARERQVRSLPAEEGRPRPQVRRQATAASAPLHVLVTAGPTREHIDAVRYLSNESSGRMGFAIAAAAAERGWRVTLVTGPVSLQTPPGVTRVDIESARDLLAAARAAFRDADALFMAAAVADFRPRRRLAGKWRKKDSGDEGATLELVRNPDVLATLGEQKGTRLVVGFALETGDGRRRALRKLRRKNADYIVLNDDTALNAERTSVTILGADGSERTLVDQPKARVARALVELALGSGPGAGRGADRRA